MSTAAQQSATTPAFSPWFWLGLREDFLKLMIGFILVHGVVFASAVLYPGDLGMLWLPIIISHCAAILTGFAVQLYAIAHLIWVERLSPNQKVAWAISFFLIMGWSAILYCLWVVFEDGRALLDAESEALL